MIKDMFINPYMALLAYLFIGMGLLFLWEPLGVIWFGAGTALFWYGMLTEHKGRKTPRGFIDRNEIDKWG